MITVTQPTSHITDITVKLIDLDVATARSFLDKNARNRPFTRGSVERFAQEMIEGRWTLTGDTIKVTLDGQLLDGQHRCAALIRANDPEVGGRPGTTIPVLLVTGVDPEAQDHMDIGKKRSVSDQLVLRGLTNTTAIAAAARLIALFTNNNSNDVRAVDDRMATRHLRLLEWIDSHPEIQDHATNQGAFYGNSSGVPGSSLAAASWLISQATNDDAACEVFFSSLRSGADLSEGSPILSLRNRVNRASQSNEHLSNQTMLYLVLRTWNAWRTGVQLDKFPVRSRGKMVRIPRIEP